MKGTVKWFSSEKGYGFVTGEDGQDRFTHARSVVGAELPKNGSQVEFESFENEKGLAGNNVKIIRQSDDDGSGRVTCPNCNRSMVPRITFYRGGPQKSFCPFCGTMYKDLSSGVNPTVIVVIIIILGLLFFIMGK